MSLMSIRLALIHRCTIQRNTNSTPGDWGGDGPATFEDNLTDLRCRLGTTGGRERVEDATFVAVEDMRLIVEVGTDVTTEDIISEVTFRGETIMEGPVSIRAVLPHQDHLELLLEKVS